MKIFLWGAGALGKRFFHHIPNDIVEGFIDSDEKKIGTYYEGKPIISFDEYMDQFREDYIVISHLLSEEAIKKMEDNHITRFFMCNDCPSEWVEEAERNEFTSYVDEIIAGTGGSSIIGLSLYGLLIAEQIHEKNKCNITIYYENQKSDLANELKKEFDYISFKAWEEQLNDCSERIYNATNNSTQDERIIDINNCYRNINNYHNDKFIELKDKCKGRRIFIVGLGPSLNTSDLEILKEQNEISISMNRIYKIFEKTNWRPSYYIATDTGFIRESINEYIKADLDYYIIGDTCGDDINDLLSIKLGKRFYKLHLRRDYRISGLPEFSEDMTRGAIGAGSVSYVALQLAMYLGASEIILIGFDNALVKNNSKKYRHFFEETKLNSVNYGSYVFRAFEKAKDFANKKNVKIYNASRGGELESFERKEFDELISVTNM